MIIAPVFLAAPWEVSAWRGYNAGFPTMERPELLPFWLPDGTLTKQFISYDPSGGNTSGTQMWHRYTDANGEWVIFDEYGSGCLYRQQMNVWWGSNFYPSSTRIKYYFDDETTPRHDMTFNQFFGYGKSYTAPFNEPLVYFGNNNMFAINYYPFPFKKRLKITMTALSGEANAVWFQYTYLKYPTDAEVQTWTGTSEDSQTVRNQWNNLGTDPKSTTGNLNVTGTYPINNGSFVTVLDLSGQGSSRA